jgi:hypothetical protein
MINDEWIKADRSNGSGGNNCVQVRRASATGQVFVRDSKQAAGPMLSFTPAEWEAFVAGVKAGEFDPIQ